jgi:hypothetical protein
MNATKIAERLAQNILPLCRELLPNGRKMNSEYVVGSLAGEVGKSLCIHLTGEKAGVWCEFNGGVEKGDALELVKAVLRYDTKEALAWSRRWLGIGDFKTTAPTFRPAARAPRVPPQTEAIAAKSWASGYSIAGSPAETYLRRRGLQFDDPAGEVLRFVPEHARKNPDGNLERHPALIALLRDIHTAEPCGLVSIYLLADGRDRIRDDKGKTTWGRLAGAVVTLNPHEGVTNGLILAEGVETGISLWMAGLRPCWVTAGTSNMTAFPVLSGIAALTVASDVDQGGQEAAAACAKRWRAAGREVRIIKPPAGDFADLRRAA